MAPHCLSLIMSFRNQHQYYYPHHHHGRDHRAPRVRFARPVVTSISRGPTRFEILYMNLLEDHSERCVRCELLRHGIFPYEGLCRRGRVLSHIILGIFVVKPNGRIYSSEDEFGVPTLIEISPYYWATHGLLRQCQRIYY